MDHCLIPLFLQFFADGGEDAGADQQPDNQPAEPQNQPGKGVQQPGMEDLAATLIKAVEARVGRAERSTVRSIAEQYGMREDELNAILTKARAEKARELPEDAKKQIAAAMETANNRLIAAEVTSVGASMGLIDTEAALAFINREKVKVDEKGAVTGVKEALEALRDTKGYLFGHTGAWGQKQGEAPDDDLAAMRRAMGLPPEKK